MTIVWDIKADTVHKGDNQRDVSPLTEKTIIDENGFTHYKFSKIMFNNPWYKIPTDDLDLFKKFLEGGSRAYPSDGRIPCDVVAGEARAIINRIFDISKDQQHTYYKDACEAIKNANQIFLQSDPGNREFDDYNRLLAWVLIDGELLQYRLISKGLAEVFYIDSNRYYTDLLKEAQINSKEKRMGKWGDYLDPYWDYQNNQLKN